MKCRKCGKNDAGFFISWSGGGGPKVGFCESCAEEAGIFAALRRVETLMHGFGLESGGLFSASELSVPVDFAEQCQSCGTSLREFESKFYFGCEECALVFGSLISNYLTLLGANDQGGAGFYKGEPPKCFAQRSKLQSIQNKIKEKIEKEDYDGAAKLRDAYNKLDKTASALRKKAIGIAIKKDVKIATASRETLSGLLMDKRELLPSSGDWLMSHVEIRRNFADFKFPSKSDKQHLAQVRKYALGFLDKKSLAGAELVTLSALKPLERLAVGERYFGRRLNAAASALISPGGGTVLINDTDHITAGYRSPARDPLAALDEVRAGLRKLENGAEIAFAQRFGYITTMPSHIGTGLTVSITMHLPYSFFRGSTIFWPENTDNPAVKIESFCGKNPEHHGFFRVMSSVGFGSTAEEIVSDVFTFAAKLAAEQERMRTDFKQNEVNRLKNILPRVMEFATRSYRLSYRDVLRLTTFIMLAIERGLVDFPEFSLDDVIPMMSSPFIMYKDGRAYSTNQCEKRRADLFAELIETWSGRNKPRKSGKI